MEGAAIHNWVIIIYNMRIIVCRWMDIVALPILPRKQHSLQYFFFRVEMRSQVSPTTDHHRPVQVDCRAQEAAISREKRLKGKM